MSKIPAYLKVLVLCAASLVIGWRPLLDTFALALRDDQYTHILLIIPVSATLLFLHREFLGVRAKPSIPVGLSLLVVAALVAAYAWKVPGLPHDIRVSLSMLALVTWWVAAFILCFGVRCFWHFLFPLCFLFWLVPAPEFVLNRIVSLLQQGSAEAAYWLFTAAGVPVAQDGVVLSIPGLTVEVAKECSSIRSSLMLLVTSMVLAHLFLRSMWRQAVVMLVAIPLSVAKNGLRIFVLAMLGTRVDPSFMHGNLHHHGGIVFFTSALLAQALLLWLLSRSERPLAAENAVSTRGNGSAAARPGVVEKTAGPSV